MNQPVSEKQTPDSVQGSIPTPKRDSASNRGSRLRKLNKGKNVTIGAAFIGGLALLIWWLLQFFTGGTGDPGNGEQGQQVNQSKQASDSEPETPQEPEQQQTLLAKQDDQQGSHDILYVLIDEDKYLVKFGDTEGAYQEAELDEVVAMARQTTGKNKTNTRVYIERRWNADGKMKADLIESLMKPEEENGANMTLDDYKLPKEMLP